MGNSKVTHFEIFVALVLINRNLKVHASYSRECVASKFIVFPPKGGSVIWEACEVL